MKYKDKRYPGVLFIDDTRSLPEIKEEYNLVIESDTTPRYFYRNLKSLFNYFKRLVRNNGA